MWQAWQMVARNLSGKDHLNSATTKQRWLLGHQEGLGEDPRTLPYTFLSITAARQKMLTERELVWSKEVPLL